VTCDIWKTIGPLARAAGAADSPAASFNTGDVEAGLRRGLEPDLRARADLSNNFAAKYGAVAELRPWPTFSPARADHPSAAVHMTGLGPPEDWSEPAIRRRALESLQP